MDTRVVGKGIAGALSATALVIGGIDASVLNERPFERIETVAEYRVEAKQVENLVETTFPWKDQEGLKVVVDLGEPTIAERIADKRTRQVVTETVGFGDGGFKVDILLNERPDTNRFCYTIEGAENYDFFHQPPLTEEEIKEGAIRPPEIEGSYAVYHKTLRDHVEGRTNYATGKVMHIPRPQVWSLADEEAKQWADLSYEDGELCVTAPEEFLATAELPIRIDPTFGYTSVGASQTTDSGTTLYFQTTATESATLTGVSIYCSWQFSGSAAISIGWYSDSSDEPNARLATASGMSDCQNDAAWQSGTLSTSVTSSTKYHFGMYQGAGSIRYHYDTGLGGISNSNTGFSALPDPATPAGTNTGRSYSIYTTYPCVSGTCTDTYSVSGTYSWTAPASVKTASVACWGAGGGADVVSASAGGGGGGGAYASSSVSVIPGTSYPVVIGDGGTGGTTPTAGGDSTFATTSVVADAGGAANNALNGVGGSTTNSTGEEKSAGGDGSDGNTTGDIGGGGGGAGGPSGAGQTPSNATGGVGANGGAGNNGSGGSGGTGDSNGSTSPGGGKGGDHATGGGGGGGGDDGDPGGDGGAPGGGGGGGEVTGSGNEGGDGADGQCTITYTMGVDYGDFPIVANTAQTSFGSTVTSMPVNIPPSTMAGDLLLAFVEARNSGTWTVPSGWTELDAQLGGGSVGELTVFYKVLTANEPTSVTWTASAGTTASWQVMKIINWHGTTIPAISTGASGDASAADPSSLTPSWGADNTLWIAVAGHTAASTAAWSDGPTNYTDFLITGASSGGAATSLATAQRELNASSEDPGEFTVSGSNRWWAAFTVGVRPIEGAAPPAPSTAPQSVIWFD